MLFGLPTRQAAFRFGFSPYDVALALLAPLAALWLRSAVILTSAGMLDTLNYCAISAAFSLTMFAAFGINRGIPEFFTVRDVLTLAKAVVVGEVLTGATMFSLTRLDGIPRSVPAIHALTLGAGLFAVRVIAHIGASRRIARERQPASEEIAVVLIGVTKLSALYMKLVDALEQHRERIVALLDEKPQSLGRTVNGVRVFGRPADLDRLIVDFALHGVEVGCVVVAGEEVLSAEALAEVRRVCVARGLELNLIPQILGVDHAKLRRKSAVERMIAKPRVEGHAISLPRYFRYKRPESLALAALLVLALTPLMIVVAAIAFVDVGMPIFFWQQRIGLNGRTFLLYKLRTLKEPFDWRGERIPDAQRLSKLGKLLRKLRLDELPQLLNVLVGDMAFIGPRPLLPQDQPPSASARLMVRPGITGWAQVNGGTLLSPIEKGTLDHWYLLHASVWLDLRILVLTIRAFVRGDRKSQIAFDRAQRLERSLERERDDAVPQPRTGEPRRIVFLNRFFYPDQSATSQILSDLAFDLAQRGHDIHIFTSRQRYDDPRARLPAIERVRGVTIHRVKTTQFGRAGAIGRVFDYVSFYGAVWRSALAWTQPGDILVAKTDPPLLSVVGRVIAKRRGLRLVNWLQDLYPEVAAKLGVPLLGGFLGRQLLRLRDASLRSADANIAIGERMAEIVRTRGVASVRVHVIPNWCNDEEIFPVLHEENPCRREWQLEGKFVVGYSGNLGRGHEFDTLLAAAEILRDEPRLLFLFIGGGKKLDGLRRGVRLDGRFRFLPYQDRRTLRYSLGAADAHVVSLKPQLEGLMVPSKFYGIAAAGRPAIAITAADGEVARLVRAHDCGVVIEPGQGAMLADTLRNLMRDRDRLDAMGRRGRAMIEEHFTRRQAFERWSDLLENLGRDSPPPMPPKPASPSPAEAPVAALSENLTQ